MAENSTQGSTIRPFIISRTFDAPRERVWKLWAEPEGLRQWFGPKGCTISEIKMDLKPGGTCLCCVRTADGHEMWGKFHYREISEPAKLRYTQHFSDRAGAITRHPGNPHWPLQMLTTVTFGEQKGRTTLTVRWEPLEANDEERKTFDSSHDLMNQGWGGSFDQLANALAGK